jgi:hypothetical protein
MQITYWGEAVNNDVIVHLNSNLPEKARLKVLALHEKVFDYLQDWGILRQDIILGGLPPYDYHLLLVRPGFFARPERYLFEKERPAQVFSKDTVPLVALYKTGPEFETKWPALPR